MIIMNSFNKLLKNLGIQVNRWNESFNEESFLLKILKENQIRILVDIGANKGQYAKQVLKSYSGKVISFEPGSSAHLNLSQEAKEYYNWIVAPKMALGSEDSTENLYITKNDECSSLFKPTSDLSNNEIFDIIREEKIEVNRLDKVLQKIVDINSDENVLVKIDTQGNEYDVILGCLDLDNIKFFQVEVSIKPVYLGGRDFFDCHKLLVANNYELVKIFPGFTDSITYHTLQMDVFYRKNI